MSETELSSPDERVLVVLGRLVQGALHEIANPLLALNGYAELALADAEGGPKLRSRLEVVQQTGQEITQIVRAMQSFVRLQHEAAAQLSLADATEAAAALVRRVVPLADERVVVSVVDAPEVRARPASVASVLVGLLLDALATTEHDLVEVVVSRDGGDAVATIAGGGELRLEAAG